MAQAIAPRTLNTWQIIWYNWLAVLVFWFCYAISSFVAASDLGESKSFNFTTIWTFLLGLSYGICGTLVLRREAYRTPLAVGFLLGVTFMMIQLLLIVAVNAGAIGIASSKAVTAFASLLFISLLTFLALLFREKNSIISNGDAGVGASLPPANVSSAGAPAYSNAAYGGSAGFGEYPKEQPYAAPADNAQPGML